MVRLVKCFDRQRNRWHGSMESTRLTSSSPRLALVMACLLYMAVVSSEREELPKKVGGIVPTFEVITDLLNRPRVGAK